MSDFTGRNLGKYQLRERLGRGGMADVYKAYQPGMERFVAVKLMHGHLAESEDFIERFRREAQSVGQLRHPNIVQVIDFDVEDDVYYMVMEYIKGETLKAYIRQRGALPISEALRITEYLADALAYAHEHEMVHRDIKPANVMFTDSTFKHPVLTDFGIARILGASGITVSGAFIGTPAYMSPEAGRGTKVDERADIYSLGVMLYEMLTGRVPYDADTPFAVVMKHVNEPLPSIRVIRADVPESVELVLLKTLAKYPEERFQEASAMKVALREARESLSGVESTRPNESTDILVEPDIDSTMMDGSAATNLQASQAATVVEASGVATPAKPIPGKKTMPLWQIGAAVVAVAIVVVIALVALGGGEEESDDTMPAAQVSETPQVVASETPTVEPTTVEPTASPTEEVPSTAVAVDTAADLMQRADSLREQGEFEEAIAIYGSALELDPDSIDAYLGRATALNALTRYEEARQDFDRVLEAEPDNIQALRGRALAYMEEGNQAGALADYSQIIELDEADSEVYGARGAVYLALDRYEEAVGDFATAIELAPEVSDYYARRADAYVKMGEWELASADFGQAIEYGGESSELYVRQGWALIQGDEFDRAITAFEQALALDDENADAHAGLGTIYKERGELEAALESYTQVIELEPDVADNYVVRGMIHLEMDNPSRAAADLEQAVELDNDRPGAYLVLGQLYDEQGRVQDALDAYSRYLDLVGSEADDAIAQRVDELQTTTPTTVVNATQRYTPYVESDTDSVIDYANRTYDAWRNEGHDAAVEVLNEGLETYPDDPVLLSIRMEFHLGDDDSTAALADAERIVELRPEHPAGYLALSRDYFDSDEYDSERAFDYAEQALALAPNHWEVLYHYGLSLRRTNNIAAAVTYYDQAQQAGGPLFVIVPERASAYWEMRDYESAVEDYVFLTEEYGGVSARYNAMGGYILLDNPEAAMRLTEEGFITEEDEPSYWANAAYIAFRAGEIDAAKEWANTALAYNGDEYVAVYVLGLIAAHEGNYEEALEHLEVIEPLATWRYEWPFLNPTFGHDIMLDIARVLAAKGEDEQAESYFTEIIESNPEFHHYRARAKFYISRSRFDDAIRDYIRAIDLAYYDENLGREIADELVGLGLSVTRMAIGLMIREENADIAILVAEVALEDNPEDGVLLALRGQAYLINEQPEAAFEDAQRAIEFAPDQPGGYILLANYYHWVDQPAARLEAALQAFRVAPNDTNAILTYARTLRDLDDNATALELYRTIGDEAVEQSTILQERGSYALELGEVEQTIADFSSWLELQPDNPQAMLGLATAFAVNEQPSEAIDVIDQYQALTIEDDRTRSVLDLSFSIIAYRVGAIDLSQVLVERSLEIEADNPRATYVKGLLAAQAGDYDQALELLLSLESLESWRYDHELLRSSSGHTLSFDIARVYRAMGDVEQAKAYYEDIPWNAYFYLERGEFYQEIGETELAREDYRQAERMTDDAELRDILRQHIVELGPAPRSE